MKRKVLAVVLAFTMIAVSLAGCTTSPEPVAAEPTATATTTSTGTEGTGNTQAQTEGYNHAADHETFKIGLAFGDMSNENLERIDYQTNYIAPQYNAEFIVSEALSSAEAELTFIENAAIAGAQGILTFDPPH